MKRILIIEDDAVAASIYSAQLRKAGFEVAVATDGPSALESMQTFKPDGFLVDFMLPKMNGFELTKQIRANPEFQNAIIVAYSNAAVPQVREMAKEAGVSQLFDKSSLNPGLLLGTFKQAPTT
jgi:CheY-like chemotaxis protein